jgi:hypothetical protein
MINYLAEELGIITDCEKEDLRRNLCDSLGRFTAGHMSMRALKGQLIYEDTIAPYYGIPFGEIDKLIAASSLGYHRLVSTVMKSLSDYKAHPIFGSPLERASASEQILVVKAMLHQLAAALQDPEQAKDVQNIVKDPAMWYSSPADNGFCVMKVILYAIERSDLQMLEIMTTWYRQAGLTFSKAIYNFMLGNAIRQSTLRVFRFVLDISYTSYSSNRCAARRITVAQYSLACTDRRGDIIKLFLEEGYINPLETATTFSHLIEGVRSDCVEIVELLLQAGANVNAESKFRHEKMLPIEAAILKKNPIITQRLIDAGAHLPNITGWPRHEATYEVLRQAKIIKDGGAHVLEYKRFKRMSEEEIEQYQAQYKAGSTV